MCRENRSNPLKQPKNGYISEDKSKYREVIWGKFKDLTKDTSNATVILFPSKNGEEIGVAIGYGLREENIIACDSNAAVLATAKWREKYPKIRIYAGMFDKTIERIKSDNIKIDAINLDLCTNLSTEMFNNLHKLLSSNIMEDKCYIAITMLKGRELGSVSCLAKMLFGKSDNLNRMGIVYEYMKNKCRGKTRWVFSSEYKSGNKKMVYGIFSIIKDSVYFSEYKKIYGDPHIRGTLDKLDELNDIIYDAHGSITRRHNVSDERRRTKKEFWIIYNNLKNYVHSKEYDFVYRDYEGNRGISWNDKGPEAVYYFRRMEITGDYLGPMYRDQRERGVSI
jgi:hypothetical protein